MIKIIIFSSFFLTVHANVFANDIKQDLFKKYCLVNDNYYLKCDFRNIDLTPYSNELKNEMHFNVSYKYKNCKFDFLNIQLFSYIDYYKINLGEKKIDFNGFYLRSRDIYEWDTYTNNYDKSCSFFINEIRTSFSNSTKRIIDRKINFAKELKKTLDTFKEMHRDFSYLYNLINNLDMYTLGYFNYIKNIENEIVKIRNITEKSSISFLILVSIEQEIEMLKISNPIVDKNKFAEAKNNILKNINELLLITDIINVKKDLENVKYKISEILYEAESIPNFDKDLLEIYNKILKII
ncbi:hypothetical protein [Fluviispira multicolorata]|uniref:Uncharacterized protein n=1 Tax=Fluviispira multicolorata TaxID=2654512 RepID=A0A833JFB6_9BACT|nr:hypothetical protein [Fluviispira multicolorata]KAB8033649.1 hypothetical protein GCL57_02775 [Fluviispira multicolorata]